MVEEILDVPRWRDRATNRDVQGRRRVRRQVNVVRFAERGDAKELRESRATRGVGLHDIDGSGFDHPSKVNEVISVFAGRDVHARRRAIAQQAQACQIVRRHRLFEPRHPERREPHGLFECELAVIRAVRIDKQRGFCADRRARRANAIEVGGAVTSHFHLHTADAGGRPAGQLLL